MGEVIEFSEIEKYVSDVIVDNKYKKFRHYNLTPLTLTDDYLLCKIYNGYRYDDNTERLMKLYENRFKLCIVLKDNIYKDNVNYSSIGINNLKAVKKCYKINDNMADNSRKLAKLLYKMFIEKNNNYYFVIVDNEKNTNENSINLKDILTDINAKDTYLYFALLRVAVIAYNNNFTFKIYFTTVKNIKSLVKNKTREIKEIENYDCIELGTKEQKEYYYNNLPEKIKTNGLLYIIFELILDLNDCLDVERNAGCRRLLRQIIDLIP